MRVILRLTKSKAQRYYEQRGTKVFKRIWTFFCGLLGSVSDYIFDWANDIHDIAAIDKAERELWNYRLPPELLIPHAGIELTSEQIANFNRLKSAEAVAEAIDIPEPVRTLFLVAQEPRPEEPAPLIPPEVPTAVVPAPRRKRNGRADASQVHLRFYPTQSVERSRAVKLVMCLSVVFAYRPSPTVRMMAIATRLHSMAPLHFPEDSQVAYNLMQSLCRVSKEDPPGFIVQVSKKRKGGECLFSAVPREGYWLPAFIDGYLPKCRGIELGVEDRAVLRKYGIMAAMPEEIINGKI